MSEVRRVLLANGQYIEIVQETGSSTGSVMSQNAVTAALNGKANTTHTHAASDITSGAFGSARIADGAITSGKLAANAVVNATIVDSAVTSGKLSSNSVTTTKVVDGAITRAKLADDVISSLPSSSYETVIISASTTSGLQASAKGAQVQVNSVTYTFNTSAKIYVIIPYGQVYSVTPLSNSYAIPLSAEQTFTASVSTRSVSLSYTFNNGIYIEDKQGLMWDIQKWSSGNNSNANSVAVITDNARFRVALIENNNIAINSTSNVNWSSALTSFPELSDAVNDYNGVSNTNKIIALQPSTDYAAGWCNAYTFPNGTTKGYLPSLGEWYELINNKTSINNALLKCGGTTFATDHYTYYWSSTYLYNSSYGDSYMWRLEYLMSQSPSAWGIINRNRVRPFGTL